MTLTKEQILNASDISTETVEVPEWGGEVIVSGITARARDNWEVSIQEQREKNRPVDVRASLCALAIIDEAGNRVFDDSDVKALAKKSAAPLHRVFNVAMRLSGINDEAIEELEGNLKTGQSECSCSD